MKSYIGNLILLAALIFVASCGYDNYEPPKSTLTGNVIYNGAPIGVRGTGNAVQLELWQDGFELYTSIPVYVTQDGSFSASLFDGEYKMVSRNGNGPWVSSQDTILVSVKGDTQTEYEVTPFYTISNENFSLDGNVLTATFDVAQVAGNQSIERAILVVNKTAFVDESAQISRVDVTEPGTGQITMTMELNSTVMNSVLLNARVGVKVPGREAIYSSVQQIK